MNGYICLYRGELTEVYADTSRQAQLSGKDFFQAKYPRRRVKDWEVAVTLAERGGEQVTHTAVD